MPYYKNTAAADVTNTKNLEINMVMKKIIAVAIFCVSANSFAGVISAQNTTITGVSSYGSGNVTGDILIKISGPVTGCENGYYLPNNNEGKEEILSLVLSAFHAGTTVTINAYDSPRWPGSGANYCYIEAVHLKK